MSRSCSQSSPPACLQNNSRDLEPSLQAWAENKVPMMPPGGDLAKDRKAEQKVDMKKRTQAEIEQEMAALQYTNPMLLEVRGGEQT